MALFQLVRMFGKAGGMVASFKPPFVPVLGVLDSVIVYLFALSRGRVRPASWPDGHLSYLTVGATTAI